MSPTSKISELKWPAHLTPFWEKNPEEWFISVEAIFHLAQITDECHMAQAVITYVGKKYALLIGDLARDPDPVRPYSQIKERLIGLCKVRCENRLRRSLQARLSDQEKPSHILSLLNQLNRNECNENVLRKIFLDSLPPSYRPLLGNARTSDLSELGRLADEIVREVEPPYDSTMTQASGQLRKVMEEVHVLRNQVDVLQFEVNKLRSRRKRQSFRRFRYHTPSVESVRSRSRSPLKSDDDGSHQQSEKNETNVKGEEMNEEVQIIEPFFCKCNPMCENKVEHFGRIRKIFSVEKWVNRESSSSSKDTHANR